MNLPEINQNELVSLLSDLVNIPSPTGFTSEVIQMIDRKLGTFRNLDVSVNRKGALIATWQVERQEPQRGLTAHVDTLGAMVKEIKSNGRLKLSKVGGYAWNTIEGEGCWIFKSDGGRERGSILLSMASSHVHGSKVSDVKRDDDNMEVRLDARTNSEAETKALGVQVGDFIAFDPRFEFTKGFIRSRHLDDKACVACIIEAVQALQRAGLNPLQPTCFHFSNYEEVGHGASTGFPASVEELITIDMAAVGDGQASDEFSATLCVKDSGGPYHHGLSQKLRSLAEKYDIPYKVDIYPYYGSDGEAFWRAGGNVSVALIGPGVDASHNYERTHIDALVATTQWIMAYLLE